MSLSPRAAFSLVELLVVIAVVAILAGMLMPAISMVRQTAQGARCQSNLRQLVLGAIAYSGENDGLMPQAVVPGGRTWYMDWDQCLGRYLGLQWQAAGYWRGTIFSCPAETIGYSGTGMGYAINAGLNDPTARRGWPTLAQMGKSTKIIAFADGCRIGTENPYNAGGSYVFGGYQADANSGKPEFAIDWRNHRQSANLAMADGHVEAGRFAGIPSVSIVLKSEE
jgi:prepilin-type N-terminal cleavage/methylation domain-containing protein/prepilin-type processing-associated H-X9-DG protein